MGTPYDPDQRAWPQQPYQQRPAQYPGAGQYGAQYRQPAPPGQWNQPPPTPTPTPTLPPKPSKTGGTKGKLLIIGAATVVALIVVVVALVVVVVVVAKANEDTKKIDVAGVQRGVQEVLVDRITGYTSDDIQNVKCNDGRDPTVKKGGSFTCNVTVRGKQHQLTVTFQDTNGTYEVGLPQLDGGK